MTVGNPPKAQEDGQGERLDNLGKCLVAASSTDETELETPAPGATPFLGPGPTKSTAPTPLELEADLQVPADDDKERRQYLKTGVEFGKQTTQWAYDEINKRDLPIVGKNTCAKVLETAQGLLAFAGLDKLAPKLVSSGISTLDTYVEKADNQLEKVLETERGRKVESAVISATAQGIELASQTKVRTLKTISGLKNTATSTIEQVTDTTKTVVDTVMKNDTVGQAVETVSNVAKAAEDMVVNALDQGTAAYDAVTDYKAKTVQRVQENVEYVKELPSNATKILTEYTDYDGDGTVTIQDLRNTAYEQLEKLQRRLDEGVDYYLPDQQVEEVEGSSIEDPDQVSLRSKVINRLAQRFQVAKEETVKMTAPYIGEKGIKAAQQASAYVEYLRGLELKDLPIPAAAKAKLETSLDFASKQVTYVKDAFFTLLKKINVEEYAAECGKPFETISPYFERLSMEKSITEVPAEVVSITTTLIGLQRGSQEVQALTAEIENLMKAICDVSTLFNLNGKLNKDG